MSEEDWNFLYKALAHGDDVHKAWLRGLIQGMATCYEDKVVEIHA